MYLRVIEWEDIGWIHVAHYRDQWRAGVEHGNEPLGFIKAGEFVDHLNDC
jgi:hypothetical protein